MGFFLSLSYSSWLKCSQTPHPPPLSSFLLLLLFTAVFIEKRKKNSSNAVFRLCFFEETVFIKYFFPASFLYNISSDDASEFSCHLVNTSGQHIWSFCERLKHLTASFGQHACLLFLSVQHIWLCLTGFLFVVPGQPGLAIFILAVIVFSG